MFRGIEFLAFLVFLIGLLWYLSNLYRQARKARRQMTEVYFSGGPLNGNTERLEDPSKRYTFLYNKPLLIEGKKDALARRQEETRVAIYNYQGDGVYIYQGSVDEDQQLDYELTP
jgi:hypothetical protein